MKKMCMARRKMCKPIRRSFPKKKCVPKMARHTMMNAVPAKTAYPSMVRPKKSMSKKVWLKRPVMKKTAMKKMPAMKKTSMKKMAKPVRFGK